MNVDARTCVPGTSSATMERVITAKQFQAARARSRMTNRQLATLLDVSVSTISNWLREGVVPRSEADVEDKLGLYLRNEATTGSPLRAYSDVELLAELWQRMDAYKRERSMPGFTQAEDSAVEVQPPTGDRHNFTQALDAGVIRGTLGKRPRPKDEKTGE